MATSVHERVHDHVIVNELRPTLTIGIDVAVAGIFSWLRLGCSV